MHLVFIMILCRLIFGLGESRSSGGWSCRGLVFGGSLGWACRLCGCITCIIGLLMMCCLGCMA